MPQLCQCGPLSADEDLFGQYFAIKDSPFYFLGIKPFDGNAFVHFWLMDFKIKLQNPKIETYLTSTLKGCTASL